jgi:hypothetical protein
MIEKARPWLDADRAFNERVARVVFGPPSQYPRWWWFNATGIPLDEHAALYAGPKFGQEIAAAWMVVERMLVVDDQEVFLAFMRRMAEVGWCAPEHIACPRFCEAALAALEGRDGD